MSVDNLRQEHLEAGSAVSSAQRSLSAALAAESNAPEKEKESAKSKIEQAKSSLVAASERQTMLGQLLRTEESYAAKVEALEKQAEEAEKLKQEEAEHKKAQEQEKAQFEKVQTKASKDAGKPDSSSNVVNGEELVRSGKPLSEEEILEKMQKMIEQSQETAKPEETIDTGDKLVNPIHFVPGNAEASTSSTVQGASVNSATGTQAAESEGAQLKAASGSSGTST